MTKKRTREQKVKAAAFRETISYESDRPSAPTARKSAAAPTIPFARRDFVKTLVSTLIVLGVLLSLFVYTTIL